MRKVIIMVQHRTLADRAIRIFAKSQQDNLINIEAIVSESSYNIKMQKKLKKPIVWINNNKRNEDKILRIIKSKKIDTIISLQHKWIISEKIIKAVNGYAFNIHFGKLPDYRGDSTLVHVILNEEKFCSITLQWMSPKVDLGLNAYVETIPIQSNDTAWSLYEKCLHNGIKMLKKLIINFNDVKKIPKITLKGKGHFYSINILEGLKEIKTINNYNEIDIKSRAFYFPPHEPAYIIQKNKKFYVLPESSFKKQR